MFSAHVCVSLLCGWQCDSLCTNSLSSIDQINLLKLSSHLLFGERVQHKVTQLWMGGIDIGPNKVFINTDALYYAI